MTSIEQAIVECKAAKEKVGYLAWHADAERRTDRGERQFLCGMCKLWRWKHELCEIAEIEEIDDN